MNEQNLTSISHTCYSKDCGGIKIKCLVLYQSIRLRLHHLLMTNNRNNLHRKSVYHTIFYFCYKCKNTVTTVVIHLFLSSRCLYFISSWRLFYCVLFAIGIIRLIEWSVIKKNIAIAKIRPSKHCYCIIIAVFNPVGQGLGTQEEGKEDGRREGCTKKRSMCCTINEIIMCIKKHTK